MTKTNIQHNLQNAALNTMSAEEMELLNIATAEMYSNSAFDHSWVDAYTWVGEYVLINGQLVHA